MNIEDELSHVFQEYAKTDRSMKAILGDAFRRIHKQTLTEAIEHCSGQRWGGDSPEAANNDSEYRSGQWRGANDCVLVLTRLRDGT